MAIYDFFVSRNSSVSNAAGYIGHTGRLFYDSSNGVVKLSDGSTPGGLPIPYTIATDTIVGGIKAGPGANVSIDGMLTVDTSGLPLSFGDFTANTNIFTLVNSDQDMVLATSGNAEIQLVGNIGFYKPNGLPPNVANRYFKATEDGQVTILTPITDPLAGAVQIIGSASGASIPPAVAGVMLHITGNNNEYATQYIDGVNNWPNYIGRRFNGSAIAPTAVKSGNVLARFSAQGYTTSGFLSGASASISIDALEDFTGTATGSVIRFYTVPVGSNTRTLVSSIDNQNGFISTRANISGNLIVGGNIIGNATTTSATIGTANIAVLNVSGNATISNRLTATTFSGKYIRNIRNAGTIADGGTLTVNFATDAIVYCAWANGMTIAYSNFTAGSIIKIMCAKDAGSGTDILSLGGVTAGQVSSGSTTITGSAGTTTFLEIVCTGTDIGSVFVKL